MTELTPNIKNGDFSVVLPCSWDKFNEFVAGLLGTPQVISRFYSGNFTVNINDIENFFYLIEQRVHEQNEASLVQFLATVKYTDGTSVQVGSLADLRSYSEVRPLVSHGVLLTWVYLVKFRGKDLPEKQQIEVDINVLPNIGEEAIIDISFDRSLRGKVKRKKRHHTGSVDFKIGHTARSWGADIENLLSNHIENFVEAKEGKVRSRVREWSGFITFSVFCLILSLLISAGFYAYGRLYTNFLSSYKEIGTGSPSLEGLTLKIDKVVDILYSGVTTKIDIIMVIYIIVSIIFSLMAAFLVSANASASEPSFVLLTRKSIEQREKEMENYNSTWFAFWLTLSGNVAVGVAGNIVFTWLWAVM